MLSQLIINNFAIISHLEIHFKPGLSVLSGETGAGKSIIINAVNLILGGRASADLIRTGADEARVEALFVLPENSVVKGMLRELGLPFEGDLLIKRHLSREGRNRITINSSIATLQILSRIGMALMSISGQHEHQVLLKPENHLYLLDDFGALTGDRLKLNAVFESLVSLKAKEQNLEKEIREREAKQDLAGYQREEIDRTVLRPGEDQLLEGEKKKLLHVEQLKEVLRESYGVLYEEEDSLLSRLSWCIRRLEKGGEMDDELKSIAKGLSAVKVELEEAALDLREKQKGISDNPERLERVEERLQLINKLKRKYGPSIDDILQFRDSLCLLMTDLHEKREALTEVRKKVKDLEKELVAEAAFLSSKRKQTAGKFEEALKKELAQLDMAGTRFRINFYDEVTQGSVDAVRADGMDRVEFLISPNVGEDLKALSRVASGGELSRIMLAMKTIMARTSSVETIIFDEVDSGIGGSTAEVVGEKLRSLALYHQILCITHLPQIASKGSTHFAVRKRLLEGRTGTVISELDQEERVKEIARLLGGKTISQKAMAHAREMLS